MVKKGAAAGEEEGTFPLASLSKNKGTFLRNSPLEFFLGSFAKAVFCTFLTQSLEVKAVLL